MTANATHLRVSILLSLGLLCLGTVNLSGQNATISGVVREVDTGLPVRGATVFLTGTPLEAPGLNLEIYDKVKSLDFEYFDGYVWLAEWSSEEQILAQEQLLLEEAQRQEELQNQVSRVSENIGNSS